MEYRHHLYSVAPRLVYLVAIIDWYSRKVLAWRLSIRWMRASVWTVWRKLSRTSAYPKSSIPTKVRQFTSDSFYGSADPERYHNQYGWTRSRTGQYFVERLWRTLKYEDVYLKGYESMPDLILGLTQYFLFYNEERLHQSLGYTNTERGVSDSNRWRCQDCG